MAVTLMKSVVFAFGVVWGSQAGAQAVSFEDEVAVAKSVLGQIQPRSIAENVEYCGVIGLNHAGVLVASIPTRGEVGSCLADEPSNIVVETASYHTHGGYSADYINELPSIEDIEGDEADGVVGYIATPAGRLWYNDPDAEEIFQICGSGCLPSDPLFIRGSDGAIFNSYTYDELYEKLGD